MGKEFKHPRRKCQICGYSVSYSNFKRHLRNAHPGELTDEQVNQEGGEEMMGHHMDDSDRLSYNAVGGTEQEKSEIVEGYIECKRCGDHVMKEFMPRHMRMTHGEELPVAVKGTSPRPRNIIMRACPECGVEMRSDSITKHCKIKHKVRPVNFRNEKSLKQKCCCSGFLQILLGLLQICHEKIFQITSEET